MKETLLINHLLEPGNRISGISNYLFSLLKAMIQEDRFRIVLLTCWQREQLPVEIRDSAIIVEEHPFVASQPLNILRQNALLHMRVRRYHADLVFNSNPVGGVLTTAPKIFVAHDLYFDVSPNSYKWHHRLWWNIFFPLACRSSAAVLCVSANTQHDVQRFHPGFSAKTRVVLEAPCLEISSSAARSPERFGLFVANVSPNKGAQTLVHAMSLLAREGQPLPLHHVGSDDQGRFPEYAAQFENGAGVYPASLGYLPASALSELYASARYLAFPSHFEGFGLPVLEAQSHGLPVIASDIPVLREVAGEGALFFPPGDARALADCMKSLHDDDALFSALSKKALANATRFSWEKAARETGELITHCIKLHAAA
ncbi:glycosyltransferase family 1 protein [Uliginosibacterium sp. 31-12]|uniref:glycosyltransferase family 4 protein n=1 Tax=Uliginosibacterium sp. 31-12 TaxID=3062781 RepID=UPI0026E20BF9|nr:glycosyltransferase family 1 protein [Uliginosibacterium sp. 31-12]MDO6386057.1 glycosyltransferase family 1 protein [Uliginosibacterium sp. 31-12]